MKTPPVAGIDVGGPAKGFHAVALVGDAVHIHQSPSARDVASWCREMRARVVGVDAPCRWSAAGRMRAAERQLMAKRIPCFATPTREAALAHPKQYYGWMLAGESLFEALSAHWTLFAGGAPRAGCMFETFPHAVTQALSSTRTSAAAKRRVRREVLARHGVRVDSLRNMDHVDAALCALTARLFLQQRVEPIGDVASGFIVVPRGSS